MKLYVCGSSWAKGVFEDTSWPMYLSELLNMELVDTSESGIGNAAITRKTVEYFEKDTANLVVIQWSYPGRQEYRINNEWAYIIPKWPTKQIEETHQPIYEKHGLTKKDWTTVYDFHKKYLMDDYGEKVYTDMYKTLMSSFLRDRGIPYVYNVVKELSEVLNKSSDVMNKRHHPNDKGHRIIAQYMYDELHKPRGNMSIMDNVK